MNTASASTLGIGGMTCAACVGRVERALAQVPGVLTCSVNLATESAHLSFASEAQAQAAAPLLRRAVRDAGYEPRSSDAAWANDPHPWQGFAPIALGLLLSFPLTLPMFASWLGGSFMLAAWVQCALATPIQLVLGARFYRGAWHALRQRSANMDVLVALGTSAAWLLSMGLWLLPPASAHGSHEPHLYFEGAAVVITLVRLGKWLEERVKRQTTAAIRALHRLRPAVAHLEDPLSPSGERELPADELRVGDVVRIRAGESVPADGLVVKGRSAVNEAMLTGEPLPVPKAEGDRVTGGSLNVDGLLHMRVTAVGAQSLLSRIIARVEQAQAEKAPIQRLVDRVSEVFVPAVLGVAFLTLLGWRLWGAPWDQALVHAVSVLVIACPCAMGLATPTALVAGTGLAARHGILIRDAQVLELAHHVEIVAFDKTGTLTQGTPVVAQSWWAHDASSTALVSQTQGWALAFGLQQATDHPLAKAVVAQAQALGVSPAPLDAVTVLPGRGVRAQQGESVYELARLNAFDGLDLNPAQAFLDAERERGASVSALVRHSPGPMTLLGLMSFTDRLKPEALEVVAHLQQQGLEVHVLSGDQPVAVEQLAHVLGLPPSSCQAALTPEGKAAVVANWRAQGRCVAFVGDGINDAPALAAADVGVAMASAQSGSDVVLSTAGMTLLRGDLRLLPLAWTVSSLTLRKIRQNLFWAFAYNVAGIPLAAFGWLSPMVAGAAMALSSVSVMLNSARLRRARG